MVYTHEEAWLEERRWLGERGLACVSFLESWQTDCVPRPKQSYFTMRHNIWSQGPMRRVNTGHLGLRFIVALPLLQLASANTKAMGYVQYASINTATLPLRRPLAHLNQLSGASCLAQSMSCEPHSELVTSLFKCFSKHDQCITPLAYWT